MAEPTEAESTETFVLTAEFLATPRQIYDAWMSSEGHTEMTGGAPAAVEAHVGGDHTAWDGYITGKTLALVPGRKIVQSWRTSEFAKRHGDSKIEVTLEPDGEGTRLTLRHSEVPTSQASDYKSGWVENYFEPMKAYFASQKKRPGK
jgi:uncharacterized protein YndB with AHSA1/START domain